MEAVGRSASSGARGSLAQTPHAQRPHAGATARLQRRQHRAAAPCRAEQQGSNSGGSSGGGEQRRGTDWDAAWQRYQSQRASAGRGAATRTKAPRGVNNDPNAARVQDAIRKQESVLLNLWASQGFQGGMALFAAALLVAVIAGAGPPPSDPRCTLPWC